jgi:glycosyltransferase involved in cell wall biosynthesis
MAVDPLVQNLLSQATFTPVNKAWLPVREQELAARLRTLPSERPRSILLVNATKGLQFYPSVVDYFVALHKAVPGIAVTSASYFGEIHELGPGVARKGLAVRPIGDVLAATAADLERYDVIVFVGPSDAMMHVMRLPGLKSRLVLVDLGFYHQLIDATNGVYLDRLYRDPERGTEVNEVICYSCQPCDKIVTDLKRLSGISLFSFRWFPYIPVGYAAHVAFAASKQLFDVALLGTDARDYTKIDPAAFPGVKFLFLGNAERSPEIAALRERLDLTVVSKVDEVTYAKLLALCRFVVMPLRTKTNNVLLSAVDALVAGKPILASNHEGFDRLKAEGAPMVFFDTTDELTARLRELLAPEGGLAELSAKAVTFARERLDMYVWLEAITREQLL